ncbi:uncharacterized protein LOC105178632 [Sesamum indicum]|uniref:Uncharacterized protein LOC105178632 n=1 Tax=Sesamum indicum TaxID=4182 RepID=A0A8M8V7P9_SESIN|nr:uncharacterized protein LOC105178632 [Sesamum indicum]
MPNGITRKQPVVYEFTSKFCTDCNRFGHLQETCQSLTAVSPVVVPAAAAPAAAPTKLAEAAKSKPTEWTIVHRRDKGKTIATAAKPAVEVQQPPSPPADKVEQGRQNMRAPQPQKPEDAVVPSPADSVSSSADLSMAAQNKMPGRKTEENAALGGTSKKRAEGESPLNPHEDRILEPSSIPKILSRSFPGWCQTNNFDTIAGGRILVVWDPTVIDLHPVDISPQVIHCRATNKSSQLSFYISFTYGLYSVVNRRSMWDKLTDLGQALSMPWLIMGDFNCVKSPEEKQLGVAPIWYELKDFVDCCVALGLLDVPTMGCYYTWYSNNESNPVWCKLDRVLYNNEWLEAGLYCSAHFNPPGCLSDHSPGIVSIFDHAPTKPKPFRFFNMWADHPDFLATVEARWNLSVDGTPQFSLCRRLKALKSALKVFNKQHYSHISARATEAELALQDAQNQLESNPGDVALRNSLGDLRKKVVFLAEVERHFFYQKAKIHHLKEGDRNTKFFHDMVKRNVARNSIGAITRADGTVITAAEDGVFEWGPLLSPKHTVELCRAVMPLEVKDAIFHISDNKAAGPDGYFSCFFKKAWNIVGDQVCRAVLDFFRCGRMLRQLNHTIIALVPKSDHSTYVADYRPILCCNVIYKAITKIISDRLAPALKHLIDRCQATFVGGRNITDNIFLAQEMVRQYSKKRISPRLAMNGSLHGFFPGKKGLRQGDPMSPALSLLSMEYFSRLVKRKTSTSDFNFHPKCEKLKITHLLFADDLMLFSRGDLPSIHVLMERLQEFRDVSGLTVNTSKSSIFTAGIQNEELDEILARTEFARGEMPVRYLGIPLAAQRLSVTNYSPLVDQIANCISKWTSKSLSYGRSTHFGDNTMKSSLRAQHPVPRGSLVQSRFFAAAGANFLQIAAFSCYRCAPSTTSPAKIRWRVHTIPILGIQFPTARERLVNLSFCP